MNCIQTVRKCDFLRVRAVMLYVVAIWCDSFQNQNLYFVGGPDPIFCAHFTVMILQYPWDILKKAWGLGLMNTHISPDYGQCYCIVCPVYHSFSPCTILYNFQDMYTYLPHSSMQPEIYIHFSFLQKRLQS